MLQTATHGAPNNRFVPQMHLPVFHPTATSAPEKPWIERDDPEPSPPPPSGGSSSGQAEGSGGKHGKGRVVHAKRPGGSSPSPQPRAVRARHPPFTVYLLDPKSHNQAQCFPFCTAYPNTSTVQFGTLRRCVSKQAAKADPRCLSGRHGLISAPSVSHIAGATGGDSGPRALLRPGRPGRSKPQPLGGPLKPRPSRREGMDEGKARRKRPRRARRRARQERASGSLARLTAAPRRKPFSLTRNATLAQLPSSGCTMAAEAR